MAFGTIMVNVDFDEDSQDRIHIAAGISPPGPFTFHG
jgi:hypothetical protein